VDARACSSHAVDTAARSVRPVCYAGPPPPSNAVESRDPGRKAWLEWDRDQTYRRVVTTDVSRVETWTDLTHVEGNLVSFQAFHDITAGNNTASFPPETITGYQAAPGWDPVTGWGSPDAQVLVPLLARYASG
jgi:hypothetical protein